MENAVAAETRLAYAEDRVRAVGHPIELTAICFEEATAGVSLALRQLVLLGAAVDNASRWSAANKAHEGLMRAFGLVGDAQSALDLENEDADLALRAQIRAMSTRCNDSYSLILENLLEIDREKNNALLRKDFARIGTLHTELSKVRTMVAGWADIWATLAAQANEGAAVANA